MSQRSTEQNITRYSLINMMNRMSALNSKTSSSEPPEETRKKALDQLIFRELAFQEAVRQGLSVDEQRLDGEMSKFITSVGHEEGYKDFLEKQDLTPVEVRSQVERSLLLQLVAIREVAEKVSVSDDEVRKEYDRQKDQYLHPGEGLRGRCGVLAETGRSGVNEESRTRSWLK